MIFFMLNFSFWFEFSDVSAALGNLLWQTKLLG